MQARKSQSGFSLRSFQKARLAQSAAKKKTGFSRPACAPRNSTKYFSVGAQCLSNCALPATCVSVIHPCCEFQMTTGNVQSANTASASHGPDLRRCVLADGESAKKITQQTSCSAAVYLQRKPRPSARPAMSQSRVFPSGCAARHPATTAHIQHNTSGGSIVINTEPTTNS